MEEKIMAKTLGLLFRERLFLNPEEIGDEIRNALKQVEGII